jgi:hypothetical protein
MSLTINQRKTMEWFIHRQKIADYTSLLLQYMVKRKENKQKKLYTFFSFLEVLNLPAASFFLKFFQLEGHEVSGCQFPSCRVCEFPF